MSIPDFQRAEYVEPRVIEGEVLGRPIHPGGGGALPRALLFGLVAAAAGSAAYALIGLSGFMISIVAIGVAWLIAKAMMAGSGGVGGRPYQIGAVVLTYLAVSSGEVLHELWVAHQLGAPWGTLLSPLVKYTLIGPFLELHGGLNGILGIVILGIGMRAAWQMTAGGYAASGRRVGPFGMR